jgi:hypothetical protein
MIATVRGTPRCAASGGGLLLEASYQRERRQLSPRKAAFSVEPTAPNQVCQLDFTG